MTYTLFRIAPATGEVITDETWQVSARSEWDWRADLVRDSVNPKRVGSYRIFKDLTETYYDAYLNVIRTSEESKKGPSLLSINEWLSPTRLPKIRTGAEGPWSRTDGAAAASDRISYVRASSAGCIIPRARGPVPSGASAARTPVVVPTIESTPGAAVVAPPVGTPALPAADTITHSGPIVWPPTLQAVQCLPPGTPVTTAAQQPGRGPAACPVGVPDGGVTYPVEERIEFAAASVNDPYIGGIVVLSEKKVNGVVIESFKADSLTINLPSAATATPAATTATVN
jgi:hypothetical protein